MLEKHLTHIFNATYTSSFSHRRRKLFNIYRNISHTPTLDPYNDYNKRFIPCFTSSNYQLQCMQDLELITFVG